MLLPSGNPFKCHEEVLYFQLLIPPKRFDIFFPLTGGCSEGLGAFRFFFKQQRSRLHFHQKNKKIKYWYRARAYSSINIPGMYYSKADWASTGMVVHFCSWPAEQRENIIFPCPSPFAPSSLVSRNGGFGRFVPRQPAHASTLGLNLIGWWLTHGILAFLPISATDGVHPFVPPTAIGPVPSLSDLPICSPWTFRENHSPNIIYTVNRRNQSAAMDLYFLDWVGTRYKTEPETHTKSAHTVL